MGMKLESQRDRAALNPSQVLEQKLEVCHKCGKENVT